MKRLMAIGVFITFASCDSTPEAKVATAAAHGWTRQYAKQQLRAYAAGSDCQVLLIEAETKLDHSTVESIQYGTTPYNAYDGGAQQFAEDRRFRAVVYRDSSGGLWTYGAITRTEARTMPLCR